MGSMVLEGQASLPREDEEVNSSHQPGPTLNPLDETEASVESITDEDIRGGTEIGEGGFGVVLVLNHHKVGKVALKRIKMSQQNAEDQTRRVKKEGRIWQRLEHANVVPILGILFRRGDIYLVSPYASNGSLEDYVREHDDADRPRLLAETAAAIAYLHREKIIHGDLKASNILVSDGVHALLCDFGLSRSQDDATSVAMQGAGSSRWQSPELMSAGSGKTYQSDVWAFGMTIFQVLGGKVPYHQHIHIIGFVKAIMDGELPGKIPTHSERKANIAVWDVAVDCWQIDPAKRPSMESNHHRLEVASALPWNGDAESESVVRAESPNPALNQQLSESITDEASGRSKVIPNPGPTFPTIDHVVDETAEEAVSMSSLPFEIDQDSTLPMSVARSDPKIPHITPMQSRTLKAIAMITVDDINSAMRIGGGGFGDVYMLNAAIGKLALKHIRTNGNWREIESQRRRATREAETWRDLTHPNVLPFLDVIERDGDIYLVSPFVQNGTIVDFTARNPDVDRARLIQEAAAGIAYVHHCGIIHGDIKGAHILVSNDGRSLICGFYLARSQQSYTSAEMQGMGTVRWQSPELVGRGAGKTFKSDVWAFGMTIYEVLSGRIPYKQYVSSAGVVMALVLRRERPVREPATSTTGASYGPLWDVAGACWHEDPDQRPEMQEVHEQLVMSSFQLGFS